MDSNPFNITSGGAHHLAFTTQPVTSAAGVTLTPAVAIQDEFNNTVTTDTRTITLTLLNRRGATLLGTVSLAATNGVATWTGVEGLNIRRANVDYSLQAGHGGAPLSGPSQTQDSTAFTIQPGVAHHLAFTTHPADTVAGQPLLPQVTIQDEYNNTVTADDRMIALTLLNAGGATLNGTTSRLTAAGVAAWIAGDALNVTQAGSGYRLRATRTSGAPFPGSDTVDSDTFTIIAAAAARLSIANIPSPQSVGVAFPVLVRVLDAFDNLVGVSGATTITLTRVAGTGNLTGTLTQTLAAGQSATSFAVTYDTAEAGVTVRTDRTAGDLLASFTSNPINFSPSAAVALRIDPIGPQTAGVAFSVTVRAVDPGGLAGTVTANTDVQLSRNSGSGTLGGTLTGTILAGQSSVTINGVTYSRAESGVSLTATRTSGDALTAGNSPTFDVGPGAAAALRFGAQPTNTAGDATFTVSVEVIDGLANVVTTAANAITLALVNPAGCSGTLSGTITRNAVGGVATFPGLQITQVCSGYQLQAAATGLTGATSTPFSVTPGTNLTGAVIELTTLAMRSDLSVRYKIDGSQTIGTFRITYGLDRDNALPIDEIFGSVDITGAALRAPGDHTVALADIRPQLRQFLRDADDLVVQLDSNNQVTETTEADNVARTRLRLDLAMSRVLFATSRSPLTTASSPIPLARTSRSASTCRATPTPASVPATCASPSSPSRPGRTRRWERTS